MDNMDDFLRIEEYVPTPLHIVNRHATPTWKVQAGQRDFHNVMLVVSGSGVCILNGEEHDMIAGKLFYHPVNQSFGYDSSKRDPLHCLGGNFSVHALHDDEQGGSLTLVERLPLERVSSPRNLLQLIRLWTELVSAWNNRAIHRLMHCRSLLLHIISELLLNQIGLGKKDTQILNVAAHMRTHYACKHSLADLAAMTGLTPSYFGQRFKALTGETPIDFLNTIRIEKVLEALALGSTISEAASKCGFQDPFYFTRLFKKRKGVPPSAYINQEKWFL